MSLQLTATLGNILFASKTCEYVNSILLVKFTRILGEIHPFLSIPMVQRCQSPSLQNRGLSKHLKHHPVYSSLFPPVGILLSSKGGMILASD
jgi:hypothetical protein